MKIKFKLLFVLFSSLILLMISSLLALQAEESSSDNFKLVGAEIGSGGDISSSTNYSILGTLGQVSDERLLSSTYAIEPGFVNVIKAHIPKISCFETSTSGSTNCLDADINPDGMVMICGTGGCYDKARFEIDSQNNPIDTLYSIQITVDPTWTTYNYVDGSTFQIEDSSTHDINDYLTETVWEGTVSNFNLVGLIPDTTYYIRATALHGDFTETKPSPQNVSATTSLPQIRFDIDISGTEGILDENSGPYTINIGKLSPQMVTTADDLIWFDIGTNAQGGLGLYVKDQHNGINSVSNSYTIFSTDEDLSSVSEGFGLQEYGSSELYLGPLLPNPSFDGVGEIVGGVSSLAVEVFSTSSNPVYSGRGSLQLKAKSDTSTPAGGDYSDLLSFTLVGSY